MLLAAYNDKHKTEKRIFWVNDVEFWFCSHWPLLVIISIHKYIIVIIRGMQE